MAVYINDVLDYLDEHPIGCYDGNFDSFMRMLYDAYTAHSFVDSEEVRVLLKQEEELLACLASEKIEKLHSLVRSLCMEHEVIAFSHGVAAGMYMMSELRELP